MRKLKGARKGNIIDASVSLFNAKGFYGTSLDDIADLAGVTRGLILYYFGTKENLFQDVYGLLEIELPYKVWMNPMKLFSLSCDITKSWYGAGGKASAELGEAIDALDIYLH